MREQFEIEESRDAEGRHRLTLLGELDLSVADTLEARLEDLRAAQSPVRLDLSKLTFIDSTGIRVVTLARMAAQRNGWQLEIEPQVSPAIRRPLQLLGLDEILWPKAGD